MTTKELLQKHGFHFNKKYGQNFISDGNLLDSIVADAEVDEHSTVLEIGAGAGTLTARLASTAAKVVSYEIDSALQPVLQEALSSYENVTVRFKDFMREDVGKLQEEFAHAKVVANLPYYITTPVIMRLLENGIGDSITVMVQKEVAERLTAAPAHKEYGSITVKVNLLGGAKVTRTVSRAMFYPVPNVDSAIVRIDRTDKYRGKNEALTDKLVKSAFLMRRKTLVNNLGDFGSKEQLADYLAKAGIDKDVRGETLSAEDFIRLSDVITDSK